MDCDDIGWNSSKMILRLVSRSLSADPSVTGLLQGEYPEIFARIGVGADKSDFWRTKALISLKTRQDRTEVSLLMSNETDE